MNVSSNTTIATSGISELPALRQRVSGQRREIKKVVITTSQADGLTANVRGLCQFLQHFEDISLTLFVFDSNRRHDKYGGKELVSAFEASQSQALDASKASFCFWSTPWTVICLSSSLIVGINMRDTQGRADVGDSYTKRKRLIARMRSCLSKGWG